MFQPDASTEACAASCFSKAVQPVTHCDRETNRRLRNEPRSHVPARSRRFPRRTPCGADGCCPDRAALAWAPASSFAGPRSPLDPASRPAEKIAPEGVAAPPGARLHALPQSFGVICGCYGTGTMRIHPGHIPSSRGAYFFSEEWESFEHQVDMVKR